ncbi:MAG: hypothetical protein V1660_02875 [archaeon]
MKYYPEKREIFLERELSNLDKFVVKFCKLAGEYVIVSGYVSIILGRSRATEDVDMLVPDMNKEDFRKKWKEILSHGFECINTSKPEEAYNMLKEHAIRFFRGVPLPNMEFKTIKNDIDRYSFENRLKINLGGEAIYISPIEMQIAYKLFLGSDKDIEDAKHLYEIFKEKLNNALLLEFIEKLQVSDKFKIIK